MELLNDPLCVQPTVVEGVRIKRRAGDCIEYEFYAHAGSETVVVARLLWPTISLASAANQQIRTFLQTAVTFN